MDLSNESENHAELLKGNLQQKKRIAIAISGIRYAGIIARREMKEKERNMESESWERNRERERESVEKRKKWERHFKLMKKEREDYCANET